MDVTFFDREIETASTEHLREHQLARLRTLVGQVLASNPFYGQKLAGAGLSNPDDLRSIDDIRRLPFTTKEGTARRSD